jgi:predicted 3-demethylubiquinone-9 3-methyltransferase (glyoxalase superfamily)
MKPFLGPWLALAGLVLTLFPHPSPTTQETTAMPKKPKLTTSLWFQQDAEEAIRFYVSLFPDAKVLSETRWGEGGPMPKGSLMAARFQLAGQEYVALNGAPGLEFNDTFSLAIDCETQAEVDRYWDALTKDGGEPGQCGWLKDRFGVSWQVVPSQLPAMLGDEDPARARRVGAAMMQMKKLDIARLEQAASGH